MSVLTAVVDALGLDHAVDGVDAGAADAAQLRLGHAERTSS